jgi:hypothetical protein
MKKDKKSLDEKQDFPSPSYGGLPETAFHDTLPQVKGWVASLTGSGYKLFYGIVAFLLRRLRRNFGIGLLQFFENELPVRWRRTAG